MIQKQRVYVASSWRNEQQPEVVRAIRGAGHEVYDFKNPAPGDNGFGWRQITAAPPPWSASLTRHVLADPIAEHGFLLDLNALRWCSALVMVQPCGRSAALELGYVAGLRDSVRREIAEGDLPDICGPGPIVIALLADGQEPELMLKCADHLCTVIDEVLVALYVDSEVQRLVNRDWFDAPGEQIR